MKFYSQEIKSKQTVLWVKQILSNALIINLINLCTATLSIFILDKIIVLSNKYIWIFYKQNFFTFVYFSGIITKPRENVKSPLHDIHVITLQPAWQYCSAGWPKRPANPGKTREACSDRSTSIMIGFLLNFFDLENITINIIFIKYRCSFVVVALINII